MASGDCQDADDWKCEFEECCYGFHGGYSLFAPQLSISLILLANTSSKKRRNIAGCFAIFAMRKDRCKGDKGGSIVFPRLPPRAWLFLPGCGAMVPARAWT